MEINRIMKKISDFAYANSSNTDVFIVSDDINVIGSHAFENSAFYNVILPENITSIADFTFSNSNIHEMVIPNGVTSIGYGAFRNCKYLKKVIIPDSVNYINEGAFAECSSLEEIYLPDSIKSLEPQMFLNCKNLKKIHLPSGITHIPDEFFKGCPKLDITLDTNITSLGQGTFSGCSSLSEYPSHVTNLGSFCFKNCTSLTSANINESITHLPSHLFEGCTKLADVVISKNLTIGDYTFRNCRSLKDIPKNITGYGKYAFENCIGLHEIEIAGRTITEGLFRGCVNLSNIKNSRFINCIDAYGLSNTGFEEFDLSIVPVIDSSIFANSKKLKHVTLGRQQIIGAYAFYNCPKLEIDLGHFVEHIGKYAFAKNKATKELVIPPTLKDFGYGAFSYNNFESIKSLNKDYKVYDGVALIRNLNQALYVYACGNKRDHFNLTPCVEIDNIIDPITFIGKNTFSGAKYLKTLSLPTSIDTIDITAFQDTDITDLNIDFVSLYSANTFNYYSGNMPYTSFDEDVIKFMKDSLPRTERYYREIESTLFPFKKLHFRGNIGTVSTNTFQMFTNIEDIIFDDTDNISISNSAFRRTKVKNVEIPDGVSSIGLNAFPKDACLSFKGDKKIKNLSRMDSDKSLRYPYRLFSIKDGEYIAEGNGLDIYFTDKTMKKFAKNSDLVLKKPTKFIDYYYDLIRFGLQDEKILRNGILMNATVSKREKFLSNYIVGDKYINLFLKYSGLLKYNDSFTSKILYETSQDDEEIEKMFNYIDILRRNNITDKILFNRAFISCDNLEEFEYLLIYYKDLILNIIDVSRLILNNGNDDLNRSFDDLFRNQHLFKFIKLMAKYNVREKILYKPEFIYLVDDPLFEEFIKTFDGNTKRLLKTSKILEGSRTNTNTDNLKDLFTLMYIVGGFHEDNIIRQRALTFIIEKITLDKSDTENNTRKITGDNFHRIFNFRQSLREEFDEEFAVFFLENFNQIYDMEMLKAGFTERAYNMFREISKTSTSHKGRQRHKKVTFEKVDNYLRSNKFTNVKKDQKDLAKFVGDWYDKQRVWDRTLNIMEECKKTPRNIFTRVLVDINGDPIYDLNPEHDLIDKVKAPYTFEWLPKSNRENLILGKYCNCCAHLDGAGAGIMRASMILDCVQNLVIRNSCGEIVAKSTLYINKEKGYGVFNNMEASLRISNRDDFELIYEAFMRGSQAFLEAYNKNNEVPIKLLTIGKNRNRIADQLRKHEHEDVGPFEAIRYGYYGYDGHTYHGDSSTQCLVLKI